jgi:hypothetical protein
MKCLRISTSMLQLIIALSLVFFLWKDSTPVPGPDGRIVYEIIEIPFHVDERYRAVTVTEPVGECKNIATLAPIVRVRRSSANEALQAVIEKAPLLANVMPAQLINRINGGSVVEVSVTPKEWKNLQKAHTEHGYLSYHLIY